MNLRRPMLALFFVACGFTSVFTQSTGAAKAGAVFDPQSIEFPTVEGWASSEKTKVPGETAPSAFFNYESRDRERVSVYVYSRGSSVANELTGTVKDEFDGALEALQTFAEMGIYSNLKVSKKETAPIGGTTGKVKALRALLTFEAGGAKLNSEVYVFPYKGHVGKLRITRPATLSMDAPTYLRILKALDDLFSK